MLQTANVTTIHSSLRAVDIKLCDYTNNQKTFQNRNLVGRSIIFKARIGKS